MIRGRRGRLPAYLRHEPGGAPEDEGGPRRHRRPAPPAAVHPGSRRPAAHLPHTLVRLLETGAIPFEKPSRHRKVRLDDLLEYRRRQCSAAELALADMIADTERLGLYDTDPEDVKAALKAARKKPGA